MLLLEIENKKINIKTKLNENFFEIHFSDNGRGILPDHYDKIFQSYFTTKEPGEGTGIGLDLCKKIIEQHGGSLELNKEVLMGTEFVISLPIKKKI
jgi:signal transduction histidine kinase